MAQLTANQEKIAASEGKGPTWEDKVSAESAQSHKIRCLKMPCGNITVCILMQYILSTFILTVRHPYFQL